jgi:hypothetical protein
VGVGAGADAEQQAHEQRLEVEERGLEGQFGDCAERGRTILRGGGNAEGDGGIVGRVGWMSGRRLATGDEVLVSGSNGRAGYNALHFSAKASMQY